LTKILHSNEALALREITKKFRSESGLEVVALDRVSLVLKEGEFLSVVGPSGCGKSTLINIIAGLTDGYEGERLINGEKVSGTHYDIGMVFQEESNFPWRTTLQNVAFGLEVAGTPRKEREEIARHLIHMIGLDGFEDVYPAELSGGMRQRVALARTLAVKPKILLLDEPFGALDEQTRILLGDQLLRIWEELKQTTLLVTHSITEAVQLSTRVALMTYRPGRIRAVIDVDLPRPRSSDVVASEEFGRLTGRIWKELRTEASRGLTHDEEELRRRTHVSH